MAKTYSVEFPEKIDEILDRLAKKHHTSKKEVLKKAIALYEYLYKQAEETDDKTIGIGRPSSGKIEKELIFP
jgi:predicted transcriptional regulator